MSKKNLDIQLAYVRFSLSKKNDVVSIKEIFHDEKCSRKFQPKSIFDFHSHEIYYVNKKGTLNIYPALIIYLGGK